MAFRKCSFSSDSDPSDDSQTGLLTKETASTTATPTSFKPPKPTLKLLLAGGLALVLIILCLTTLSHTSILRTVLASSAAASPAAYAFATYLPSDSSPQTYESLRILAYQLLQAPSTRSNTHVPLLVLTSAALQPNESSALRHLGATVLEPHSFGESWTADQLPEAGWEDALRIMQIASMDRYSSICYIDPNTLVYDRLQGVFRDPAASVRPSHTRVREMHSEEGQLPDEFGFGGVEEDGAPEPKPAATSTTLEDILSFGHAGEEKRELKFKGLKGKGRGVAHAKARPASGALDPRFFVLSPSAELYRFYMAVLETAAAAGSTGSAAFDTSRPLAGLLNYVHRVKGNMPWRRLNDHWHAQVPSSKAIADVVASFQTGDGDAVSYEVQRIREYQRGEMESVLRYKGS